MWHGFDLEGKNWLKPAMAVPSASSGSMVATILVTVSKYGYKEMVPYINERDASSLDAYKSKKLAEYVDSYKCLWAFIESLNVFLACRVPPGYHQCQQESQ